MIFAQQKYKVDQFDILNKTNTLQQNYTCIKKIIINNLEITQSY